MSDECSKIFFPLRSNAAWFRSPSQRAILEDRIKVNVFLYDRVVVEDGSYVVMAADDGCQGLEQDLPPGSTRIDRTQQTYLEEGECFGVQTAGQTLLSARMERGYFVDFMPILAKHNLLNVGFVELSRRRLRPQILSEITKSAVVEEIRQNCTESLPNNRYLASAIVRGLLRDSSLAYFLNIPISVDEAAIALVQNQRNLTTGVREDTIPQHFLNFWLDLELPNFTEWTWDQVVEVRESEIGRDFRRMLHRVCKNARAALEDGAENEAISEIISKIWIRELIDEIKSRRATRFGTVASIAMNVVPFGFIPSIAKDCLALAREQESWISMLFMNKAQSSGLPYNNRSIGS